MNTQIRDLLKFINLKYILSMKKTRIVQKTLAILQVRSYSQNCPIHDNSSSHTTEECRNFIDMDVRTRIQLVRDRKSCWSCLKIGHRSAECGCRKLCDSPGCGWYHHSLLQEATVAPINSLNSKCEWTSEMCLLPLMKIQ